jgi:NIPSNAP
VPVYVIAQVDLKYGRAAQFNAAMETLVPLMEARGWSLVGAYQNLTGDLNQATDIWEVEDANAVGAALASLLDDSAYAEVAPELAEAIERESIRLAVKAPFGP